MARQSLRILKPAEFKSNFQISSGKKFYPRIIMPPFCAGNCCFPGTIADEQIESKNRFPGWKLPAGVSMGRADWLAYFS